MRYRHIKKEVKNRLAHLKCNGVTNMSITTSEIFGEQCSTKQYYRGLVKHLRFMMDRVGIDATKALEN